MEQKRLAKNDEKCATSLRILERWNGRYRLRNKDFSAIRRLVSDNDLEFVPIWGAGGLCGVSISTMRGYIADQIIQAAFVYQNKDFFKVQDVLPRYGRFRTLRNTHSYTNREIGRIVSSEFGTQGGEST